MNAIEIFKNELTRSFVKQRYDYREYDCILWSSHPIQSYKKLSWRRKSILAWLSPSPPINQIFKTNAFGFDVYVNWIFSVLNILGLNI